MNAVFESFDVEVDEEAEAAVGELEVATELGFVEREDDFDDLVFDDDRVVDHDVHAEGIIKGDAVINDGLPLLAHDLETRFGEFVAEASFVDALNEARTKVAMHDHRTADDFRGEFVLNETWEVAVSQKTLDGTLANIIDFTSTQTCAGDKPLKLPKYHYGGLGVRGNLAWNPVEAVTMLTSEGHDRKAGDSTKGKWVHIGGMVDGAPTGMAILMHPSNFRFPQPLRLNPKNPQLCIAPSQDGNWSIDPGKPYISTSMPE